MLNNEPKDAMDALVVERTCDHCGKNYRQIDIIEPYFKYTKRLYTEDFLYDDLCDSCAICEFLELQERLKEIGFDNYLTGKSITDAITFAYSDTVNCKYCGKPFYLPDAKENISKYDTYFNEEFGYACQECAKQRIDAFEQYKAIEVKADAEKRIRMSQLKKS